MKNRPFTSLHFDVLAIRGDFSLINSKDVGSSVLSVNLKAVKGVHKRASTVQGGKGGWSYRRRLVRSVCRGACVLYRFRWFMIAFSMVLALAPLVGILGAALLAPLLGCEINDAAVEACVLFGFDFGHLLSGLLLTVGLGEIIIPILAAVLMLWGAIEGVSFIFRRWRRASARG